MRGWDPDRARGPCGCGWAPEGVTRVHAAGLLRGELALVDGSGGLRG